ncbi:EAL domain-containing protein [Lentibacillus cibarius]|uniref:EAL domain-containing protein n=1 Tax=Lentibacillus cibarius TaxID=2583219 RepID=UPI0014861749|nr:EAL domain-containing protein [Lentibacillus cibarius]
MDYYHVVQPIINLFSNDICGFEMLLRSDEFDDPQLLFEYAKEQNQLVATDMESIMKAISSLKNEMEGLSDLYICVNVFPITVMDSSFYSFLEKVKSIIDTKAHNIVFEINEAHSDIDLSLFGQVIKEIKKEGFLIAMDDVGKGESTLKAILEINPDIAKIGRYFTNGLANSPKKQQVIRLMLHLFGGDTKVILEGFENEGDLQKAKELGVSFGQGYFFGRPKPINYYIPKLWKLGQV